MASNPFHALRSYILRRLSIDTSCMCALLVTWLKVFGSPSGFESIHALRSYSLRRLSINTSCMCALLATWLKVLWIATWHESICMPFGSYSLQRLSINPSCLCLVSAAAEGLIYCHALLAQRLKVLQCNHASWVLQCNHASWVLQCNQNPRQSHSDLIITYNELVCIVITTSSRRSSGMDLVVDCIGIDWTPGVSSCICGRVLSLRNESCRLLRIKVQTIRESVAFCCLLGVAFWVQRITSLD